MRKDMSYKKMKLWRGLMLLVGAAVLGDDDLRAAVEGLHGCKATLRERVPVSETFEGRTVWTGEVTLDGK